MHKKSFHRRNDSGELNVFEAARYFSSSTNEIPGATFAQKIIGEDRQSATKTTRRMSLDVPRTMMMRHSLPLKMEKQMKEKKKHKHPSSPGGRLAHFLNSLFNQTSSKKKKSKSSTQSVKDQEEEISPGWRRKRRSSISFFQTITNTAADSKSIYSSSSSGFRTPPPVPYARNPTKINTDYAFSDEKFKFSNGILDKNKNSNLGFSNRSRKNWSDHQFSSEEKEFRRINDLDDDGADSDSSSDLFDLPNHDLDYYSSGLPVYETTHMNSIKINSL
ncbi:hypothetical protein Fot_03929 [Forsythia ovata]|uniref:Protein BIG GRAIN 1-like E n=1 Tax=Forsythia ovata TaxID=205694 RepID=A0ABD1XF37_9LAMI